MVELVDLARAGDHRGARRPHDALADLRPAELFAQHILQIPERVLEELTRSRSFTTRTRDLPAPRKQLLADSFLDQFVALTGTAFPISIRDQLTLLLARFQEQIASRARAADDPQAAVSVCLSRDFYQCNEHVTTAGMADLSQVSTWAIGPNGSVPAAADSGLRVPAALTQTMADAVAAVAMLTGSPWPVLDFVLCDDGTTIVTGTTETEPEPRAVFGALARAGGSTAVDWHSTLNLISARDLGALGSSQLSVENAADLPSAPLTSGVAASRGVASGVLCLTLASAECARKEGRAAIYVSERPSPGDVQGLLISSGAIFGSGGQTSHVAVIARGSAKPCIVSTSGVRVAADFSTATFAGHEVREGDWLTIDGTQGTVYPGRHRIAYSAPTKEPSVSAVLAECDRIAQVRVYANADTVEEAARGFENGARGIGLCRLEHMLTRPPGDELLRMAIAGSVLMREEGSRWLVAARTADRWQGSPGASSALDAARNELESHPQYGAYAQTLSSVSSLIYDRLLGILLEAAGRPVVVRLLDIPFNEIFASEDHARSYLGAEAQVEEYWSKQIWDAATGEFGLRGVRLAIAAPYFGITQVRAITAAARKAADISGSAVPVDILLPFVSSPLEVELARLCVVHALAHEGDPDGVVLRVGSMIETPAAAVQAGEIARVADFVSVGTNDLTQFTWAASRDSADAAFLSLPTYRNVGLNPFEQPDIPATGALIARAVQDIRANAPGYEIGVCGEWCGSDVGLAFLIDLGVSYVSAVPSNVPLGRLMAGRGVDGC